MDKKDFLNPNSMLTPGAAGAMAMTIANTFAGAFKMSEPWPALVALGISFMFGLLVLSAKATPIWQKLVYYVLNSLVIFTVATGSNSLGQAAVSRSSDGDSASISLRLKSLACFGTQVANAQPASSEEWCCLNNRVNPFPRADCLKWGGVPHETKERAQEACEALAQEQSAGVAVGNSNTTSGTGQQSKEGGNLFFRPWFRK